MARIFSIQFSHNNSVYNAMVSVRKTPFHTEYKLSSPDIEIVDLLPSDKIISPTPDIFLFANVPPSNYTKLMNEIINAIAQHIHSVQY